MDGVKVKKIIIGLLLLVNLFLLAMLVRDRAAAAEIRRDAGQGVEAAFSDSGIALLADVPWETELTGCSLSRSLDAEKSMTSTVLGKCSVQDLGGNILFYKSEKGEAKFRGTGEFQIMPYTGQVARGNDPTDTAVSILRKMGIRTDARSARVEPGEQTTTVTLTCKFKRENAYNCTVEFLFSSESLLMIDGRRPMEYSAERSTETLDTATMLLRYLAEIRASGLICSEIRSVEPGWMMTCSASGEGSMTPFWKIETDVGQNYVNGITGKIESVL